MVSRGLPGFLMCHFVLLSTLSAADQLKRYMKYQEFSKMKEVPTDQRLKELVSSSQERKSLEDMLSLQELRDKQRLLPLTVLAAFIFAYPFYVIGINVIYYRFNLVAKNRMKFINSFQAARTIFQMYGVMGFYRGFVPGSMALGFEYKDKVSMLLCDRYFWQKIDETRAKWVQKR